MRTGGNGGGFTMRLKRPKKIWRQKRSGVDAIRVVEKVAGQAGGC